MIINALKVCANGNLFGVWLSPNIESVRKELGGSIDNINLFTDVQTFIRRTPNDLKVNVFVPGVNGDILITGGKGSYLTSLTEQQLINLTGIFRKERDKGGNN